MTDRLNVIAMVPYGWTTTPARASSHGMNGVQDLSVAAKCNAALDTADEAPASLQAFAVVSGAAPARATTRPTSTRCRSGSASRRVSARADLHFQANAGWFVDGSGAYTWRGNVKLDRPSYFTNGQLYLSDEVAMPDVIDYTVSAGYLEARPATSRSRSRSRPRSAAATSAARTRRSSRTA